MLIRWNVSDILEDFLRHNSQRVRMFDGWPHSHGGLPIFDIFENIGEAFHNNAFLRFCSAVNSGAKLNVHLRILRNYTHFSNCHSVWGF